MNIIQIEFWQMVGIVSSMLVTIIGAGWVLLTVIVKQFTSRLDERFQSQEELRKQREETLDKRFHALEKALKQEGEAWRNLERDFMKLQADLPIKYVRREDAIRQEVVIHSKLDALAAKIDALRAGG